jgi:H+-translocating NAD(P) transhydrogenase subunit alpha
MHIHALAPRRPGERRVAITSDSARRLIAAGHRVTVEPGAGSGAGYPDKDYEAAEAEVSSAGDADLVVTVHPPLPDQIGGARAVLGLLEPLDDPARIQELAASGATLFAFELVPRTTRAQAMDVLSSQATLAGYEAVIEAAAACDRIFPMLTTAAGTIRPSRVLVLGAGVAGLQAIATARRLGASVHGFDVRSAAAEQVESLGATFVSVDIEAQDSTETGGYARELADDSEERLLAGLFEHVTAADAVITTAAIPGRPAPRLVTAEMVAAMRPGSVIVDGAAATGGNCEVSRPGETVTVDGVTVMAPLDLASRAANHASQLYARNVVNFVGLLSTEDASLDLDVDDDIVEGSMVARGGEIVHERVQQKLEETA